MPVRAADQVTIQVLAQPSYVRQYYLIQASALAPPSAPTTNPPGSPWALNEPVYTAGSTDTLYTVMLTVWGDGTFQYGPVQKSSAFEAAKQAYNLAQAGVDAANTALTAANGKNKIVFSTATPTAPAGHTYIDGDTWFRKSGTTIIGQWEFVSGAWSQRTITDTVIANVNAGKINAGFLSVDRLQAGTIGVQKLLVTSFNNVIQDPGFEYNTTQAWTLTSPATNGTGTPRSGSRALQLPTQASAYVGATQANPTAVKPGQKWRVGGWVRLVTGTLAGSGVALRVRYGLTEASVTTLSADLAVTPAGTGTTYVYMSGIWEVPETGANFAAMDIVQRDTATGKLYAFDDAEMTNLITAELIVDGDITGTKIAGQTITAVNMAAASIATPHLQAAAVDADQIATNALRARHFQSESIESSAIKAGAIQVNHLSPSVGEGLIIEGNVSIIAAKAAAQAAQNTADANADELIAMQQVYSFGPEGAIISSPGEVFALGLRNDKIEMLENGQPISYWNAGQMFVTQLIAERITLGNHQIEKLGAGTVVRDL